MKNLIFRITRKAFSILSVGLIFVSLSCSKDDTIADDTKTQNYEYKTPKYVFLLIGDGMGGAHTNLAAAAKQSDLYHTQTNDLETTLNMDKFPISGISHTFSNDSYITDSAAGGTALATGTKTNNGVISISPTGEKLTSIAEKAKTKGMKVGVVTSVTIDHATPAVFYAHQQSRGDYQKIGLQMADSRFDYFAGGYLYGTNPSEVESKMISNGYTITKSKDQLFTTKQGDKVWAYDQNRGEDQAINYTIERTDDKISLQEFTQKGIEILDNEEGFFMMIEGGKIDWSSHANDATTTLYEVLDFDKTVGEVLKFYNQHKDETLVVVTADHETGGLTLGSNATGYSSYFNILAYQDISYDEFSKEVEKWEKSPISFEEGLLEAKKHFGLGDTLLDKKLALTKKDIEKLQKAFDASMSGEIIEGYKSYDPFTTEITHQLNAKAGLDWSSYSHSGAPVNVYAIGQGCGLFTGSMDNTDIPKKIEEISEL